jgi:hypothetical protein
VLEIAGREANGSCGCAPVGCGTARAGPPLNAGHWSAWAIAAGQEQGVVPCLCRCGGRGTKRAGLAPWDLGPNCALGTLAY